VSRVTFTLAVPWLPPAFVAKAVSVLIPSVRGTVAVKVPPVGTVLMPLMVTVSAELSTVPLTVTGVRLVKLKFAGDVIVTTGAGTSVTFTLVEAELPAASIAVAEMVSAPTLRVVAHVNVAPLTWAAAPLQATLATPESASLAVPDTVVCEV
jgi:hypothetical protein